ncbi:integrase/recombinase XerD [Parabacteroides sp. PF5-5]|uniref:site-specific integrase n=1 Tax=unclassified Parabacteroides TaxID=2649774 RepID=UPI002474406A|nr:MULTISPECIES: site-specific integrase [unclassified Parabacteroides]MDH6304592.1 integrase/recombinase XerD [Parabacteroides sp. PH5-39]MDH6315795.1 integrase/recombinase XerD [Parabacteroides sp. PF5-13]MDH6319454.1 integrase/recombinase XerD [Parabacteroides sp. PH5-13]MDH6323185.1 integrase/recombinase XerD [Parabacteroides sp. PH5-8]MDH6326987.1 integrase/recombinase XerD [Parabacteroides sp. PH5-41]
MDNIQLRYVFDRRNVSNNDTKRGLLQVEVRLTGKNERILISTGVYLYKNQFSEKNGFTCKNHENAILVTANVRNIFQKIESFVLSDKCKTLKDAKNWNVEKASTYSLIEFIRSELLKKDITLDTAKHHKVLMRQLEAFGKIKTFQDLTFENIHDFDAFLRKTIKASSTLNKRHSNLKHYVQLALNKGLITTNPYNNFKMPSKKSKDPTFLTEEEMQKIKNWEPVNEKLSYVKDLFLFQMLTGLAFVDLSNFDKSMISEMDGYKIIRSNRHKTDESFISLFLPEAEQIAEKYDYVLPKLSNQKYNDYLKLLGVGAGIAKTITSHVARHTYATYLLNKGIPIETVSRAMGHSSIKMTAHYARLLGKTVIKDMSILLEKKT